ncbi:hypothetical protein MAHJHV57_49940 [Mycobacterium avium subsp. hominissuis]
MLADFCSARSVSAVEMAARRAASAASKSVGAASPEQRPALLARAKEQAELQQRTLAGQEVEPRAGHLGPATTWNWASRWA